MHFRRYIALFSLLFSSLHGFGSHVDGPLFSGYSVYLANPIYFAFETNRPDPLNRLHNAGDIARDTIAGLQVWVWKSDRCKAEVAESGGKLLLKVVQIDWPDTPRLQDRFAEARIKREFVQSFAPDPAQFNAGGNLECTIIEQECFSGSFFGYHWEEFCVTESVIDGLQAMKPAGGKDSLFADGRGSWAYLTCRFENGIESGTWTWFNGNSYGAMTRSMLYEAGEPVQTEIFGRRGNSNIIIHPTRADFIARNRYMLLDLLTLLVTIAVIAFFVIRRSKKLPTRTFDDDFPGLLRTIFLGLIFSLLLFLLASGLAFLTLHAVPFLPPPDDLESWIWFTFGLSFIAVPVLMIYRLHRREKITWLVFGLLACTLMLAIQQFSYISGF